MIYVEVPFHSNFRCSSDSISKTVTFLSLRTLVLIKDKECIYRPDLNTGDESRMNISPYCIEYLLVPSCSVNLQKDSLQFQDLWFTTHIIGCIRHFRLG